MSGNSCCIIDDMNPEEKVKCFRETLPEFENTELYPDKVILLQMTIAQKLLSECAWGDMYNYAVCLLTAHLLVLKDASTSNSSGKVNGNGVQSIASKTVDRVSISYNPPAGYDASNSFSATSYGRLYLDLIKLFGVGCIQL